MNDTDVKDFILPAADFRVHRGLAANVGDERHHRLSGGSAADRHLGPRRYGGYHVRVLQRHHDRLLHHSYRLDRG